MVTARLVSEINDFETLYLLGSEGVYTDPTFTGSPARRTVYRYAVKREVALDHVAMMTQVTGDLYVENDAHIDGNDGASIGACQQSSVDITAVIMGSGSFTKEDDPIDGPDPEVIYVGSAAALDAIGIEWDVLTDTDFPVDYEDAWPSCALPADSFTVTRWNGTSECSLGSVCGRGVLIVTGNFLAAQLDSSGTAFCSPATSSTPQTTTGSTGWSWVAWTETGLPPRTATALTSTTIAATPSRRASD